MRQNGSMVRITHAALLFALLIPLTMFFLIIFNSPILPIATILPRESTTTTTTTTIVTYTAEMPLDHESKVLRDDDEAASFRANYKSDSLPKQSAGSLAFLSQPCHIRRCELNLRLTTNRGIDPKSRYIVTPR